MTMKDIEAIQEDFLKLDDVAAVLGGSPDGIRTVARTNGLEALGYPATWISLHRLVVPRVGFLNWYQYKITGDN